MTQPTKNIELKQISSPHLLQIDYFFRLPYYLVPTDELLISTINEIFSNIHITCVPKKTSMSEEGSFEKTIDLGDLKEYYDKGYLTYSFSIKEGTSTIDSILNHGMRFLPLRDYTPLAIGVLEFNKQIVPNSSSQNYWKHINPRKTTELLGKHKLRLTMILASFELQKEVDAKEKNEAINAFCSLREESKIAFQKSYSGDIHDQLKKEVEIVDKLLQYARRQIKRHKVKR